MYDRQGRKHAPHESAHPRRPQEQARIAGATALDIRTAGRRRPSLTRRRNTAASARPVASNPYVVYPRRILVRRHQPTIGTRSRSLEHFGLDKSPAGSSIESVLWPMLITLALVKLIAASMMLWLPFRTDSAVVAVDDTPPSDADDEDGGTKVGPPHAPGDPRPRRPRPTRPRRGPHGSSPAGPPPRVRVGRGGQLRVQAHRTHTS